MTFDVVISFVSLTHVVVVLLSLLVKLKGLSWWAITNAVVAWAWLTCGCMNFCYFCGLVQSFVMREVSSANALM